MSKLSIQPAPAPAAGTPPEQAPAPPLEKPRPRFSPYRLLVGLASLRLTVVLFVLSLLLVFFGTMAQVDSGIWTIVSQYFRSFLVWIPFQLLVQFGQTFFGLPETMRLPGSFPFPGGYIIGGLLLVNLLAAHLVRFKVSWKRSGILLIHLGLIVMLLGELVTGLFAIEGNMVIEEGETSNTVIHNRHYELAIVDTSDPSEDRVTVIPGRMLRKPGTISHPDLPFDIEVVRWMVNSKLRAGEPGEDNPATAGEGTKKIAVPMGEVAGVDTKQTVELPSVYVKFTDRADGKDLGTYLMSLHLDDQPVPVGKNRLHVGLRFKQTERPFSLTLKEFRFDRYMGTNTARNFSSRVLLEDAETGTQREVVIRMNEPLRYRGETFYQASWNEKTEKGTVLQVVRNPGWLLPYFSCAIVSLGMIVHFGMGLNGFLQRRASK